MVHKEMEGYLLEDKISSARMAFIYIQIQNNLKVPCEELRVKQNLELIFKPNQNIWNLQVPSIGVVQEDGVKKE